MRVLRRCGLAGLVLSSTVLAQSCGGRTLPNDDDGTLPWGGGSGGGDSGGTSGTGGRTTPTKGGATAKGGTTGQGGTATKGGRTGSGGALGKGGRTGSGGAPSKGGWTGSGGVAGSGGSGGSGGTLGGEGGAGGFGGDNCFGLPNGASCDDGDYCTVIDYCSFGRCIGTESPCTQYSDGCTYSVCDSAARTCLKQVVPDGSECKAAGGCSSIGWCSSGTCVSMIGDCSQLDGPCQKGICAGSFCTVVPEPDGAQCNDGDACTSGEFCSDGACVPGKPHNTCVASDGCCPSSCSPMADADCSPGLIVTASYRGWWRQGGSSNTQNTYTGRLSNAEYNSYFVFDLRGFGNKVRAARLLLEQELVTPNFGVRQLSVWDVSTPWGRLTSGMQDPQEHVYNDLMSGARFATLSTSPSQIGSIANIVLNADAIAAINASLGSHFSIGVHVEKYTTFGDEGVRFSKDTEPRIHALLLDFVQ